MATSIKTYMNDEIKDLKKEMTRNKKWFFAFSIILMLINIAMVVIASIIIKDLSHKKTSGVNVGLILASFAAGIVIFLFDLQFIIVIYKALMKEKTYKSACDQIQIEVFKYNAKKGEYKGKDSKEVLEKNVLNIKKKAVAHRRHKTISSILLKGFAGGEDE